MPQISVIVPVHNNVHTINRCISSLMNQTLFDLEVVIVDDCSSDGSLEMVKHLARLHGRIKLINIINHQSASIARKVGINASVGTFIMFLDADDFLDASACEKALDAIRSKHVDLLQFRTRVSDQGVTPAQLEWFERFVNRQVDGALKGSLVKHCFLDKKFSFTLWNKIYRASIVKIAAAHVTQQPIFKAQDLLLQFFILMHAISFDSIDEVLINYSYGKGITGGVKFDQRKLASHMSQVVVVKEIFDYLEQRHARQVFDGVVRQIATDLIADNLHSVRFCQGTELENLAKELFLASWGDGKGKYPSSFSAGFVRFLQTVMQENSFDQFFLESRV